MPPGGGVVGGHLREHGDLSASAAKQRYRWERACQARGDRHREMMAASQVGALVGEHGVQLAGPENRHGRRRDHHTRPPIRQAVGRWHVVIDDDGTERMVRTARGQQEGGVPKLLPTEPTKPAGNMQASPRDHRDCQQ